MLQSCRFVANTIAEMSSRMRSFTISKSAVVCGKRSRFISAELVFLGGFQGSVVVVFIDCGNKTDSSDRLKFTEMTTMFSTHIKFMFALKTYVRFG